MQPTLAVSQHWGTALLETNDTLLAHIAYETKHGKFFFRWFFFPKVSLW